MQTVGLTGGMASGKSTVSKMFSDLGVPVVSADALYHELIAPPYAGVPSALAQKIGAAFPTALTKEGAIDRKSLGAIVFTDAQALQNLGAITHPAVANAFEEHQKQCAASGARLLIYDVPLLFERSLEKKLDGVIVVWVPPQTQLQRLMQRDALTIEAATQRVQSQMSIHEKRQRATWVIDNSGALNNSRMQVKALWEKWT